MTNKSVSDPVYNKNFGRTICEVHREMHDIVKDSVADQQVQKELEDLLQEAYTMAKKMDAKLRQYKHNYDDTWWEKEKSTVIQEKLRKRLSRK